MRWRRKTIPTIVRKIAFNFSAVNRPGKVLVDLWKRRKRRPIPTGLKGWPSTSTEQSTNTICVSQFPAGPEGCSPLIFLALVHLVGVYAQIIW